MSFCTVINCMDGRIQMPVIEYLQKRFNVDYVDSITEAGPNLILANEENTCLIEAIIERLNISIDKHCSVGVAIVGHHDCAGNPASKTEQIIHIKKAIQFLHHYFKNIEVIGLWVNREWMVSELEPE